MIKQTPAHIKAAAIIAHTYPYTPIIITTDTITLRKNDTYYVHRIIDKRGETFNYTADTTEITSDITNHINDKDAKGLNRYYFIYLFKDRNIILSSDYAYKQRAKQ